MNKDPTMYQIYDPYSKMPIPKSVAALIGPTASSKRQSGSPLEYVSGVGVTPSAAEADLDRWEVETHKYNKEMKVDLGFFAKLFGGSAKKASAGVVHEAKRFRIENVQNDQVAEFGVAVRLLVATSVFESKFELSIPNLAAAAQLGQSDTRIGIYVIGFSGVLGEIMPAPEDLKVENFSKFMDAFSAIQKKVFSEEQKQNVRPTFLGYQGKDE
jgi:hypothetical protein